MTDQTPQEVSSTRPKRPQYEGEPTLAQVMRKPKWLGALVLALAVAGGFAWLGQWQLGHAITVQAEDAADTEEARPIAEVTDAGVSVGDLAAGMVVEIAGSFVGGDFGVVDQRVQGDVVGAWMVGHFASEHGHLSVAVGWAPTRDAAEHAIGSLETQLAGEPMVLTGRYMPSDAAKIPAVNEDPGYVHSMSAAQQVNLWQPFEGAAYSGFLVAHEDDGGEGSFAQALDSADLKAIDSVAPLPPQTVNWLNLFYALEWVVFAGFAVYFWFRLARDEWEKLHELKLLMQAKQ